MRARQRRGDPRAEKQRQREGQHAKARGGGAEREDVLQIERQIGHHDLSGGGEAEHGEARAEKRALAKEREIHHRPLLDQFSRDKERKQDSGRQELGERLFRRPTHAVGADQRPDETEESAAERQHARNVQSLRIRIPRLFDGVDREPDERSADWKVHEKRPAPAERRGDQAADERTHGDGDADDRSPESERLGSFRALERVPEHRQRRAKLDRRAHALQRSRRIEDQRGWREAAQQRRQVKIARPTISIRRRPYRSASAPEGIRSAAKVST